MRREFKTILLIFALFLTLTGCAASGADVQKYLDEGNRLFSEENYTAAVSEFKKAVKGNPISAEGYRGLVNAYLKLSETEGSDYSNELFDAYCGLYNARGCSAADLLALARMYGDKGDVIMYRNLLEQALRLNPSADILALVNSVAVDISAESADVRKEAEALEALLAQGSLDDAIGVMLGAQWYEKMAPGLTSGHRRYICGDSFMTEAGVNGQGVKYTCVWYVKADGTCLFMKVTASQILYAETALSEGMYNGAYKSYLCDAATKQVFADTGTFTNNVLTGAVTSVLSSSEDGASVTDIWMKRDEYAGKTFTGSFDGAGHATAAQRKEITSKNGVIYAYDSAGKEFLFVNNASAPADSYIFNSQSFYIVEFPQWTVTEE